MNIIFNEEDLKELDSYIRPITFELAFPIFNMINRKIAEQQQLQKKLAPSPQVEAAKLEDLPKP